MGFDRADLVIPPPPTTPGRPWAQAARARAGERALVMPFPPDDGALRTALLPATLLTASAPRSRPHHLDQGAGRSRMLKFSPLSIYAMAPSIGDHGREQHLCCDRLPWLSN